MDPRSSTFGLAMASCSLILAAWLKYAAVETENLKMRTGRGKRRQR